MKSFCMGKIIKISVEVFNEVDTVLALIFIHANDPPFYHLGKFAQLCYSLAIQTDRILHSLVSIINNSEP